MPKHAHKPVREMHELLLVRPSPLRIPGEKLRITGVERIGSSKLKIRDAVAQRRNVTQPEIEPLRGGRVQPVRTVTDQYGTLCCQPQRFT